MVKTIFTRLPRLLAIILVMIGVGNINAASSHSAAQSFDQFIDTTVATPDEAIARDSVQYAKAYKVTDDEAVRRLKAQQESVAETDRIKSIYKSRLAGISIEHNPEYRIIVLLTGKDPVPDQIINAGGMIVPIIFHNGAIATQAQVVAAMRSYQTQLKHAVIHDRGMGFNPRTGELVLYIEKNDIDEARDIVIKQQAEELTKVPVRIVATQAVSQDMVVGGGAKIVGTTGPDTNRFICTTAFVVTNGASNGLATAAHCPDNVVYSDPDGQTLPLEFAGQWGMRYQDVQINITSAILKPLFYADHTAKDLRPVTSWRNRTSTRAGDFVCHWGERSGYSCAEVLMTDFAPPGELCGGPCDPEWVSVKGPHCQGGDSGGPVFSGTIAFGILKGGNHTDDREGRCNFYYYMSVDFMPPGWHLAYQAATNDFQASTEIDQKKSITSSQRLKK